MEENNFKAIYRILHALEAGLDIDNPTDEPYSAERLGISQNRRDRLILMMQEEGYVKGVERTVYYDMTEEIDTSQMEITLKGIEYLQENSTMAKVAKAIKGITDVLP